MRELLFYRYFDTVIFSKIPKSVEKLSKVGGANSSSIWGDESFVIPDVTKIYTLSKKISSENLVNTTKIEHGETSGIWGDKLFLCTKLHDIYVS